MGYIYLNANCHPQFGQSKFGWRIQFLTKYELEQALFM